MAQSSENTFTAKGAQPNRAYFSGQPSEQIDTLSGNVVLTYTDLVLPGNAGHDLRFQRTFNAKDGSWIFGIVGVPRLLEGGANLPSFLDVSGAEHPTVVIKRDLDGTLQDRWVATADFWVYDRVTRRLSLPDGMKVEYDASYRPIFVTDPFDNYLQIRYAPDPGCLDTTCVEQHLSGASGQVRTVQFDTVLGAPNAFPTHLVYLGTDGQADRRWTYTVTPGPAGLQKVEPPVGEPWQYAYVGLPGAYPYVVTATNPYGGSVRYEFQQHRWWYNFVPCESGNCQAAIQTEYMPVIQSRRTFDNGVQTAEWTYDFDFGDTEAETQSYTTTVVAPDGARTTYRYLRDENGVGCGAGSLGRFPGSSDVALCVRALVDASNVPQQVDRYRYVAVAGPRDVTVVPAVANFTAEIAERRVAVNGRIYTTQWTYAPTNYGDFHRPSVIVETGELQRTTTREYNYTNAAINGYEVASDPSNPRQLLGPLQTESVTVGGSAPVTRSWTHNLGTGFVKSETQYGLTTTYEESNGNIQTATLGDGTTTSFTYEWGTVKDETTALYTVSRSLYPDGTVRSETHGGRTTLFEWDALGRPTKTTPPSGSSSPAEPIRTDYPPATQTEPGSKVRVTRGSVVATTTLDGFGRPRRIDGPASIVQMAYDWAGRKVSETLPFTGSPGGQTTFEYDTLGRITKRTNPGQPLTFVAQSYGPGTVGIEDENHHFTLQEWKAFGSPDDKRLTAVTDATNHTWQYEYTALGALTKVTAPGGVVREWRYATPGRPALLSEEVQPESGSVTYTAYDNAGRLKRKVDAKQQETQYTYDGNGRLRSVTAGGRLTTFTYEAGTDNRDTATVDGVQTVTKYDVTGRLQSRRDQVPGFADLTQYFEYDGNDNLLRVTYASGREVLYTYNSATNQVTAITDVTNPATPVVLANGVQYHPSGAMASYNTPGLAHTTQFDDRYRPARIQAGGLDLRYEYDGVGNPTAIRDSRPNRDQVFHYDPLDRLTGMDASTYPSIAFVYDPHGNRVSNPPYSTYGYDAGGRLTSQNADTYQYDPNGNLIAGSYQGAMYTYTADNQLATSSVAGIEASYRYDADGWRIAKTSGLTSLYARGVTGQLFTEIRPKLTRDYIYLGSKLIAMIKNQETGAQPEVRQVSATRSLGDAFTFNFAADSPSTTLLTRADLQRALQTATCAVANDAGCAWNTVDTQSAPAGLVSWTDTASLTDAPTPGAYLYTVRVSDATGAAGTGALVALDTTDATPSAFTFTNQTRVALNTVVASDIVQIVGLSGPVPVSVTGGAYRVCGDATCSASPTFINTASTIANGGYLQLRTTSSAAISTVVAATVSVGTVDVTWNVTTTDQDWTPDPFAFADQTDVALSTSLASAIVQITGIAGSVPVSITGAGQYRTCPDAGCATSPAFTSAAGVITTSAYLQLRVTSSASASAAVATTVAVGDGSATWTVTTNADWNPDPFSFQDRTDVTAGAVTLSNVLPITGITGNVPVSIASPGTYRICGDATCSANPAFGASAGVITNGQYLQLRLTASSGSNGVVSTLVSVGDGSDNWSVTTQDFTPDAFAFSNQNGVALSTAASSNTVQITGISGGVAVSVSGGNAAKFRVCPTAACTGVAFGTTATTMTNGQYLGLQQMSSGTNGATVTATVAVGAGAATWSLTSIPDPCAGSPAPGTTCANGSKFAGYSPITGTKMYVTPADYPGDQQFAWPQDFFGFTGWGDGLVNTNGLAVVGNHPAAAACYYLTAQGKSDWYLPSPTEMNALDPYRGAIGGFQADDTSYWTSTEVDGGDWHAGLFHVMGSTFNGYTGMGISMPIRCIRRD